MALVTSNLTINMEQKKTKFSVIKMNNFCSKLQANSHMISKLRHGVEAKRNMIFFKTLHRLLFWYFKDRMSSKTRK